MEQDSLRQAAGQTSNTAWILFRFGYRADFLTDLKAEERKSQRTLRHSKGANLRKQTVFSPGAVDTTSGLRRVAHYWLRAVMNFQQTV